MMKLNIQMFASTNKTANYELPQFIGSDKPTWLGDFNTAMATIDGGMAENKSDIESMDSRVSSAEATASQASQNVSALTTRVSTVETSVSSATTTANNAQQTATSALNTANTANGKADSNASDIASLQTDVESIFTGESYVSGESNTNKKWIDGKSIYRLNGSFSVTASTTTSEITLPATNMDTLVHINGLIKQSNGDCIELNYESGQNLCLIFYRKSNNTIQYRGNLAGTIYYHLEYTKNS